MRITIVDTFPRSRLPEGSAAAFTINVYDDATDTWALVVPTTLSYRVDNPDTCTALVDWTSLTPASSTALNLSGVAQSLECQDSDEEPRRLTVRANTGLTTQCIQSAQWVVVSAFGVPA